MKVYSSPSVNFKGTSPFICTARITGSLDNRLRTYQKPSSWTELKIHPQGTKIAFCTFFSGLKAIKKKKNPCISRTIFLHYALTVNSPHWEKHYLKINFTAGIETSMKNSMKNNHSIQGITAERGACFKEVPNSKDYTIYQKKTPPFCMFQKFYTGSIRTCIHRHC